MQYRKLAIVCAVALAVGASTFVGCKKARIKGLVPAEGVVTLNGAPVEGATVLFAPKAIGTESGSATAQTDKDGKFKMTTLDPGDGVFPGDYYVAVSKDRVEGGPTLEQAKTLSLEEIKARQESGEIPPQVTYRDLPAIYADINASGLDQTIPAGGNKEIALTLEGEVDSEGIEAQGGRGSAPGL